MAVPDLVSFLALVALVILKGHVTGDHDPEFVPALEELELYRIKLRSTGEGGISQKSLLEALSPREVRLTMIDCVSAEEDYVHMKAYSNDVDVPYFDEIYHI